MSACDPPLAASDSVRLVTGKVAGVSPTAVTLVLDDGTTIQAARSTSTRAHAALGLGRAVSVGEMPEVVIGDTEPDPTTGVKLWVDTSGA